ncbi:ATPase family AAA domain-containing protein FIGL1, partial [Mucuna pruriens]
HIAKTGRLSKIEPNTTQKLITNPNIGILLFGPPGTGKTMPAKAIANEAGASFIDVSMSTITSKWFGEEEKNVRALFTLVAKVAPTIIFVDEVDSMLGQRTRVGEHEAMRKIKNEFMTHGLRAVNFYEQNLCITAAYRPVRELIQQERMKDMVKKKREAESQISEHASNDKDKEQQEITLRPLNREDMKQAKSQVAASFASEGSVMNELKQWNELHEKSKINKWKAN